MENVIIKTLENQDKERREKMIRSQWSLNNVRRLTEVLENSGAVVSDFMWNMFVYNIEGLIIVDGKITYISSVKRPSKRILKMFNIYNDVLIDNFSYITHK